MALENKVIFILANAKFDGPYESTNFTIARKLAACNTVFYIDNPYTWKDYYNLKGSKDFNIRKEGFSRSSEKVLLDTDIPNLKILLMPTVLSINFLPEGLLYRFLLKFNERTIAGRIKKVVKDLGIRDFIYMNSFNFHYPNVAKYIKPLFNIYYCVDPLIFSFDSKHGIISEKIIVKSCDLVICTSKQLAVEKKKLNPNSYFIPNAADVTHSSKALNDNLPVHPSIKDLKKPVIGYFGNIERRIDYNLLKDVILKNADKSFVFAGPISAEFVPEWLYSTSNVHLTGHLPYDQMPEMVKGFDVAIIPFKKDDVSRTIFPLKLFEYLGAGKPVVVTNFNPDLEEFTDGTVQFCNDAASFSKAINNSLKDDNALLKQKRIDVAQNNTWDKRAAEVADLIDEHLTVSS